MDDAAPTLLGRRGTETGSYFFPPTLAFSRNPAAPAEELEEVDARRGGAGCGRGRRTTTSRRSRTSSPDPFVPYTVVAVELVEEQMVVLGPLAAGVDPADARGRARTSSSSLSTLYEDDDHEYVVWSWRPA